MASQRSCLICGIPESEVKAVRTRNGWSYLGCGIESNTENGVEHEELSPRHRWAPWSDRHLDKMGVRPEFFELYRTETEFAIRYDACDHQKLGHIYAEEGDESILGLPAGTCIACGRTRDESTKEQEHDQRPSPSCCVRTVCSWCLNAKILIQSRSNRNREQRQP